MQTLIIIFAISLIGIVAMIYRGVSRVRSIGYEHSESSHPMAKHLESIGKSFYRLVNLIAHSFAVIVSRLWARLSHRIGTVYNKITKKLEDYFNHKNESNIKKGQKTQSILLTTIKAYKREIKKLNGKIEPDKIKRVDIDEKKNKID